LEFKENMHNSTWLHALAILPAIRRRCECAEATSGVATSCKSLGIELHSITSCNSNNRTLATPELLDQLGIQGKHAQFNMASCSGNSTLTGRLANNICVQSIDGESTFELQDVIECNSIPSDLHEVATKM
jgi:hypothetical protein